MSIVKWAAIVVSVLVLIAAGCRGGMPVYNVTDSPVAASKPNPSVDEVGKAIQKAGAALGWQMKPTKPGHMLATLNLREHTAVADVTYNAKSFSIQYKDSAGLKYDGQTIHPQYNNWITNLEKRIRVELTAL